MTPEEAYAALGLREPLAHGRAWAEEAWGVEGRPLRAIKPHLDAQIEALRTHMSHNLDLPESIVGRHIECFTLAAKARLYDLAMAPKLVGHA